MLSAVVSITRACVLMRDNRGVLYAGRAAGVSRSHKLISAREVLSLEITETTEVAQRTRTRSRPASQAGGAVARTAAPGPKHSHKKNCGRVATKALAVAAEAARRHGAAAAADVAGRPAAASPAAQLAADPDRSHKRGGGKKEAGPASAGRFVAADVHAAGEPEDAAPVVQEPPAAAPKGRPGRPPAAQVGIRRMLKAYGICC